ncbi:hypothetical protein V8E51_015949 [Hyaloscypha variabilis]
MSSILASKFSEARTPTAAQRHQNHPQIVDDGTVQLLFRQLRSDQVSTKLLVDLSKTESELQTYINKLRLDMENTRQDWLNQVEVLRTEIKNLRNMFSPFEDMSSGVGQLDRVSFMGSLRRHFFTFASNAVRRVAPTTPKTHPGLISLQVPLFLKYPVSDPAQGALETATAVAFQAK